MTTITRYVISLALAALCIGACARSDAATKVSIVSTSPGDDVVLARNESFYVRLAYETDEPVQLWTRAFFEGQPVANGINNASATYSGSGEALGWIGLTGPGHVDEVRVFAGGRSPWSEWEVASQALQLHWTEETAPPHATAAWVSDLKRADEERMREQAQQRAKEPVSGGEMALFNGFMLIILAIVIGGIGVPLWSMWKWRGGWRVAAAVPATVMAFVVLRILFDTTRDKTSHNLWPFEILIFGGAALVAIAALKATRKLMGVRT